MRPLIRRLLRFGLWTLLVLTLVGGGVAGYFVWQVSQQLPPIEKLVGYEPPMITRVYDRNLTRLATLSKERRIPLTPEQIPPKVGHAFLAAEDAMFYQHPGINPIGIIRAAFANMFAGHYSQGASTITQQLAKTFFLSPEKTIVRKITEMLLAFQIEQRFSKDEILALYLNQIYFGHGAYGVEAAAETYFNKNVDMLTVAEMALLASLPKAPSDYDPYKGAKRVLERRAYVLGQMRDHHWVTPHEYEAAMAEPLTLDHHPNAEFETPTLEEMVRRFLVDRFGETTTLEGGLNVFTTFDADWQAKARAQLAEGVRKVQEDLPFDEPLDQVEISDTLPPETVVAEWKGLPPLDDGAIRGLVVSIEDDQTALIRTIHGEALLRMGEGTPSRKLVVGGSIQIRKIAQLLNVGDVIPVHELPQAKGQAMMQVAMISQIPLEGALVSLDPIDGSLRAVVGSIDPFTDHFNRATQAVRQPGSSFKPLIYVTALERDDITPATILSDAPIVLESARDGIDWRPENYEQRFYGDTTLRTALEHSRNLVTIRLLSRIGVKSVLTKASLLGIQSPMPRHLGLALGAGALHPIELAGAYCALPNGGHAVNPHFIERVEDRHGRIVYQAAPKSDCLSCHHFDAGQTIPPAFLPTQVYTPEAAFQTTYLMQGVMTNGTGIKAQLNGRPSAGKTGTTNRQNDAWFIGFTPQQVTAVWVGRDDNQPIGHGMTGGRVAAPIWHSYMSEIMGNLPVQGFVPPEGITFVRLDPETGKQPTPESQRIIFEAFRKGTEPNFQTDLPDWLTQ